jgi:hypothetical protein
MATDILVDFVQHEVPPHILRMFLRSPSSRRNSSSKPT